MTAFANERDPHVGQLLGRYRLEAEITGGGMARVFRAWDTQLGRTVAIKTVSLGNGPGVARLQREITILSDLCRPTIVTMYDAGVAAGQQYLVMEYLAGGDLSALGLGTPVWRAVELVRQVCDAVAHLHARGIVHRDIKPANILIGQNGVAKVADFGIAVGADLTRVTQVGDIVGTPGYLYLDQAGMTPTPAADLYALGVVLYRILTGTMPNLVPGQLARASSLRAEIPESLDRVIIRAIVGPDRFGSADALSAALAPFSRPVESPGSAEAVTRIFVPPAGPARAGETNGKALLAAVAGVSGLLSLTCGAIGLAAGLTLPAATNGRVAPPVVAATATEQPIGLVVQKTPVALTPASTAVPAAGLPTQELTGRPSVSVQREDLGVWLYRGVARPPLPAPAGIGQAIVAHGDIASPSAGRCGIRLFRAGERVTVGDGAFRLIRLTGGSPADYEAELLEIQRALGGPGTCPRE